MTFSLVARDASGALGMVVSSSSPAVAARCIHLRSGVGAVASQNITDPRFGRILLDAMGKGMSAADALDALAQRDGTMKYRQIMLVSAQGDTAWHSGGRTLGRNRVVTANGVVAGGNLLSNDTVPQAMLDAFVATEGELERRLLSSLVAGAEAGGEEGDVHSCGLAVARDAGWPETDLRVDWHADPIGELTKILDVWMPQRDDYVTRGIDPTKAPSYGVPGDS
jgi:uncharacterized Ntn-hydrolase superfamily protein